MVVAALDRSIRQWVMLARLYIEALLEDAVLADAVWEVWSAELISDETAMATWAVCATIPLDSHLGKADVRASIETPQHSSRNAGRP